MAIDWKGVDIEERFNLCISKILEDARIEIKEDVALDEPLLQDWADILNRIEAHLDKSVELSDSLD